MELSMKYLLMAMVLIALTLDVTDAAKKSKRSAAEYKQRLRPAGDSASKQIESSRRDRELMAERGDGPVQPKKRSRGQVGEEPRKAEGQKYNKSYKKQQRNIGNSKEGIRERSSATVETQNKQKWKGSEKLRKDKIIEQKAINEDSMDFNHRAEMCTDKEEEYEEGNELEEMIEEEIIEQEEPEGNFKHSCSNTRDQEKAKPNCASKIGQQKLVQEDAEGKCYLDV